jgi:alkanesulfonate monooxygenase SsuD/methylene tetrahydromethanopterin reductase-like flavin-dependent oxidoreductase (luciferase family)
VHFALRFDFRNPALARTSMADRYAAALDMAEWADRLGCVNIALSEHHGSADGYLPSPLVMATAMAARTTTTRFTIAALIAPFYDPLRVAEDLAVLDNLSKGRVDLIVGAGYTREEFAMYGVPMNERPKRVSELMATLRAAFTGQPFEYCGRTVQVTPAPFRAGGPALLMGGSSEGAARRAARLADGFVPSTAGVWDHYRDEMLTLGKPDPGPGPSGQGSLIALAADPDKGWDQLAPFFLHETNAYGAWQAQDDIASPYRSVADIDELRATGRYRVVRPDQFVAELKAEPHPVARFHPLCGGIPPELAWDSLKLFENEVLPAFR